MKPGASQATSRRLNFITYKVKGTQTTVASKALQSVFLIPPVIDNTSLGTGEGTQRRVTVPKVRSPDGQIVVPCSNYVNQSPHSLSCLGTPISILTVPTPYFNYHHSQVQHKCLMSFFPLLMSVDI